MSSNAREDQLARAGAVVMLESLLEDNFINEKDVPFVKIKLEQQRKMITLPDIIQSLEDSKRKC